MPAFTQKNRNATITTPLGEDKLLLSELRGHEEISQLFSFDLSLFSEDRAIPFADIIGKGVTVTLKLSSGDCRYFNGIISSFAQVSGQTASGDDTTRVAHYRATLVPKLWLLTRSADIRMFQKMKVPDIVKKVLGDCGITDFKEVLQRTYKPRDYCVQYRETNFNFISRLLEDEGIFYFFEHTEDSHRLILADSPSAHGTCKQETASYLIQGDAAEGDTISSLEMMQTIMPGRYVLKDYNFETPKNSLSANVTGTHPLGSAEREIYDYPGGFMTKDPGDERVKVRMDEEEAQITVIRGASGCGSFTAGYQFKLLNSDLSSMNNKKFTLTYVGHSLFQSVQQGGEFRYANNFSCIPDDILYRPPRLTLKPVVQGAQTAIVVGPSGEEIYTDKYGRVKVQFHWDRLGKADEESSCWIRVSQLWAGLGWGAIYIPRIGQEVIVDFLEGDPDQPIITGRVYHGINMPPYNLPAEMTKSTIKSCSSKGGGGFNEFRFEDKKGSEQVFIHAENQMDVRVKKDSLEWIGNERHLIVTKDQIEKVSGDKHLTVSGDQNEKIDGSVSLTVKGDKHQKITGGYAVDGGGEIHLKAGMKVIIEAGTQLTLKAGGSYIDIGATGVNIKGAPMVNIGGGAMVNIDAAVVGINSGGSVGPSGSGSGASPDLPKDPKEADKADPGKVSEPPPPGNTPPGPQAAALKQAAQSGAPFCST